jgi:hypothetical protein
MVQVEKDKKFERGFTGSTGKYLEVAARGGNLPANFFKESIGNVAL